ncbi:unnamed protein product [Callosobruchus maculatus]|uniref:18S rRNA (guanine(1575)-N(7))-methyltransferase Bud23 C-terminal domain-containing protein n=1 Tax=Callosobruchus maculatus TaxID=64391 RepID=A0A653CTW8_CALMS|nr:unnamed protein product [Callosobruchus maculatus]
MSRPEHLAPPEIYYNEDEAKKYSQNSRIIDIQFQMSERAVELLVLPEDTPCYLLDIGCGSGLSGSTLDDQGHFWIGMDISKAMLGTFDGAISISALQWLCNADKKHHNPVKRLYQFFSSLYACLSRSARAVLQFYPENGDQMELITAQAMKAGFYGGVVVDYPNSTKAKKFFLVLMTGGNMPLPKALGTDEDSHGVTYTAKRERLKQQRGKSLKKGRDWILEKKERRRKQGKDVRPDSKYTGRKRSGRL